MHVEFYHRNKKRMADANLFALIGASIAQDGFVVDRLKEIAAKRLNKSYWHYVVPVMRVAA